MSMRRMSNMVPNFDLNEYPTEADEAAADALLLVAHEVVNAEPQDAPIDVDAAYEEVVVVSPPPAGRGSRAGSRLRAAPPSTILIDEDPDNRQLDSAEEEATRLTLYSFDWPAGNIQNPPKRAIINCDNYESLDSKHDAAKKTRVEEDPKPKTEASKEPTFNCTICWGPLVEETTTTCGHIFCQQCIKAAIRIQKRCPTCRKSLTMKSIHRIYLPAASQ